MALSATRSVGRGSGRILRADGSSRRGWGPTVFAPTGQLPQLSATRTVCAYAAPPSSLPTSAAVPAVAWTKEQRGQANTVYYDPRAGERRAKDEGCAVCYAIVQHWTAALLCCPSRYDLVQFGPAPKTHTNRRLIYHLVRDTRARGCNSANITPAFACGVMNASRLRRPWSLCGSRDQGAGHSMCWKIGRKHLRVPHMRKVLRSLIQRLRPGRALSQDVPRARCEEREHSRTGVEGS